MKKQSLLLISLFAFLFSGNITSGIPIGTGTIWEGMELQGALEHISARTTMEPIQVFKNNEYKKLCICFNKSYGQLEVTIVNEFNNQVYENNINVTTVTQEFITIGNLAKGNYTIYITNSEGKFVSGDFDIY